MENDKYTKERFLALEEGFRQKENAFHEQIWIDTNINEFDEILRLNHSKSVKEFCEITITTIAELTNAFSGVFYILSDDSSFLRANACYACLLEGLEKKSIHFGEGIIGQAANSKNTIIFEDIPPENIEVKISSTKINVVTVTIIPLIFNDKVYGIIELVFIHELLHKYKTLLDKICRNTAAVLESIQSQALTRKLLSESQEQTERLKTQEEELRQNLEELSATQETMEKQRVELQSKEIELKKMIEEMRVNEEDMQRSESKMREVIKDFQRQKKELKERELYIKSLEEELENLKS